MLPGIVIFAFLAAPGLAAAPRPNAAEIARISGQKVSFPFVVVVMGDNRDSRVVFPELLRAAEALRPVFIVNNGDVVNSGKEDEYPLYLNQLAAVKTPMLSIVGNHELRVADGADRFRTLIGPSDFSFDYGGWRFICLDTGAMRLTAEQLKWLKEQLSAAKGKAVVITHVPPVQARWYQSFTDGAKEFEALLKEFHAPLAVFSHMHVYDRLVKDGITYVVTGGAGAEFGIEDKMNKVYLKEGGAYYHFVALIFTRDSVADLLVRPFGLTEPPAGGK